MKASELMIGDLVSNGNKNVKIIQVQERYACYLDDTPFGKITQYLSEEDITPIPLTTELAERNCYKCVEVGDNGVGTPRININRYEKWECKSKWQTFILIYDRVAKRWSFHYNFNTLRFRNVHELQHAMRLCGLSDLADNFKI